MMMPTESGISADRRVERSSGHGHAPGPEAAQEKPQPRERPAARRPREVPGLVRARLHGARLVAAGLIAVLLVRGGAGRVSLVVSA